MAEVNTIQQTQEPEWKQKYQVLEKQIENLQIYLMLVSGKMVTDGKKIGKITKQNFSLAEVPEIFVTWTDNLTELAQLKQLKRESFIAPSIKTGDIIIINSKHPTVAGEKFEIKELQGNGWVLTTTNQQFHAEHFYALTNLSD